MMEIIQINISKLNWPERQKNNLQVIENVEEHLLDFCIKNLPWHMINYKVNKSIYERIKWTAKVKFIKSRSLKI